MPKKGEKRTAESKRESRARHSELHRRNTFIADYVRVKHERIYEEANNFFSQLFDQYPEKRKLTTASEFIVWEKQIKRLKTATTGMDFSSTMELHDTTASTPVELHDTTASTPVELHDTTASTPVELHDTTASTPVDVCLNIPLMNTSDVQQTRDMIIFDDIYPSIIQEIDPTIIDQIIQEIEADTTFDLSDMDDMVQDEINQAMNELSPLEKELLQY